MPFEVPYYDPWADLASRPEITYGRTFLPGGAGGLWFPDIPAITLDKRLTRVAARCVLAHELAHVDLRHGSCAGWGRERHASLVDRNVRPPHSPPGVFYP